MLFAHTGVVFQPSLDDGNQGMRIRGALADPLHGKRWDVLRGCCRGDERQQQTNAYGTGFTALAITRLAKLSDRDATNPNLAEAMRKAFGERKPPNLYTGRLSGTDWKFGSPVQWAARERQTRVSGWVASRDANLKSAAGFDGQARAFPYSAIKRVHAFSACGSL